MTIRQVMRKAKYAKYSKYLAGIIKIPKSWLNPIDSDFTEIKITDDTIFGRLK